MANGEFYPYHFYPFHPYYIDQTAFVKISAYKELKQELEDLQDKWSKSNSEATKWVEELKDLRAENAKLKSRIKELEGVN